MLTRTPGRLALLAGLALAPAAATAQEAGQIPIRQITLYRSGVGSFVHRGEVEGQAAVTLTFDASQVNDILKSMVLLDLGGGEVGAVSYSSREPLSRRLGSFAIDVSDNPDMASLLLRLRGERVRLVTVDGPLEGTVLGVEKRPQVINDQTIEVSFVTLLSDDGLKSVDLTRISSMRILNEELAGELRRAMEALAEHRAERRKKVDLTFDGQGRRDVVVAYVHEIPVWKTSYRLLLPADTGGEPMLQGWAIVENTTDEDWEDVTLSLVAGRPVSFTMDLYQPLFMARPEVPVPVMRGVGPIVYEEGVEGGEFIVGDAMKRLERRSVMQEMEADAPARGRLRAPMERAGGQSPAATSPDAFLAYAMESQATAGEVGETFQYTLQRPVSIDRQQSAMLPIISSGVEARRVSIYTPQAMSEHPMRGVEVINSSDLQLMPGPIAVYDGTTYAGDAQIGHVSAGDSRLVSYAVDLAVDVQTRGHSQSTVESIVIVNGNLVRRLSRAMGADYIFTNDDHRERTILVEHPRTDGWELVQPDNAREVTESAYRFEVQVPAGESRTLEVRLARVDRETIALTSWSIDDLAGYARQGKVSDQVMEAFTQAQRLNSEVRRQEERLVQLEREIRDIGEDQDRIRRNMGSIDRNSELYRRYIARLDEQETRLDDLRQEVRAAQNALEAARAALRDFLQSLNVR